MKWTMEDSLTVESLLKDRFDPGLGLQELVSA